MHLPVKAHYATLAMLALAEKHASKEPLSARVIAREQGIPSQFLTQILQQLRSSNLVTSTRGASGGFLLERPPSNICVADVLDSVCPSSNNSPSEETPSLYSAVVHEVWEDLRTQERESLQALKLSDLLEKAHSASDMFYI